MNPLWIVLIVYGVIFVLYAFRMAQKYFMYLEGETRNGTIITSAVAAGFIWPVTLVLDGLRGVWAEVAPVKLIQVEAVPEPFDPLAPITDLGVLTRDAAAENLNPPRVFGQ